MMSNFYYILNIGMTLLRKENIDKVVQLNKLVD